MVDIILFSFLTKTNFLTARHVNIQQYNRPCEKHGFRRFSLHTLNDWPCALLAVIENARRMENSFEIKKHAVGMNGMNTSKK